jgi:hypothetical protein
MTEKQLALLLRQLAGRLRALAAEVEPLTAGAPLETRTELDYSSLAAVVTGRTTSETKPAAIWRILDFAADLEDEAELLKPEPEPDFAD